MLSLYTKYQSLKNNFKERFLSDEKGQGLIEYTLLIALITLVVIVSVQSISTWIGTQWNTLVTTLGA